MIGKLRRHYLVFFRPKKVERMLEKRTGACTRCGVCCQLGFACAHFDTETRLCTVHECKPAVCRTFPLDFRDIADRDLQNPNIPCGFRFPESEGK
jgi:Fe-S-cluster containining protein